MLRVRKMYKSGQIPSRNGEGWKSLYDLDVGDATADRLHSIRKAIGSFVRLKERGEVWLKVIRFTHFEIHIPALQEPSMDRWTFRGA